MTDRKGVSGVLLIAKKAMEGEEEMNVLFLRFIDRILNMINEPVVLFDKELNPVKANAAGWRFFDTCRAAGIPPEADLSGFAEANKNRPSFLCEGCPVHQTKEAGLPCTKRCNQGIVQSEPLRNADGALEGVVVTLVGRPAGRPYLTET